MSSHFFQHINPERSSNAEMLLPGMQGDINKAAFEKIPPSPPRMHSLDSHLISKLFSTTAALKDLCVTCMNWFFFALATKQHGGCSVLVDDDVPAAQILSVSLECCVHVFLAAEGHHGLAGVATATVLQETNVLTLCVNLKQKNVVKIMASTYFWLVVYWRPIICRL